MAEGKIKTGVIGVGHLGEYHVQKYRRLPNVDLVGVADVRPGRAEEIAGRYGTTAFGDFRELLNKVDAVSLAVPTEHHFEIAGVVLERGVHLLIEKPITYKVDHADALIRMAGGKGLVLQVGHVERFNPAVMGMEKLLTRPVFIDSQRLSLFTPRGIDVDVVLDLMIHDLDIILHVVPSEIRELHAVGMSVITGKTDIANVRIIFENAVVANLSASRVSSRTIRKIRVFQQDAYISVDCAKRELSVTRLDENLRDANNFPQSNSSRVRYPESDPLADEIASFVSAVSRGSAPVVSGQDGLRALRVAVAIIEQIEKGSRNFQGI